MKKMKNLSLITCVSLMLLLAISCTSPPAEQTVDMESVKSEITAMETAYAKASNAKDADGVLAYYADDAQSMAPNKPTLVGKDAIKANLLEEMASDTLNTTISFAVTDLWTAGNIAIETGTSTTTNEAGEVVRTGKYMSVFEKRDGKYVCIRDIFNTDMPKEEAPIAEAVEEE
jgi:uncharacterized protein (TIGR02246 family)